MNPSVLNLSHCVGGDNVVVLGGLNITNGMRIYHIYYSYDFPITPLAIFLLITTVVLLFYGERIRFFLRSLRHKNNQN